MAYIDSKGNYVGAGSVVPTSKRIPQDLVPILDQQMQIFADKNPEAADRAMDAFGYSPTSPISSKNLAPIPRLDFNVPQTPPVYPVAGLNSDLSSLTGPERRAQSANDELQQLNNLLVGESQARADAETQQGIPALTQTQNDLSSRLKSLQNEALAIPLQLQQNATGRGITAGGLQPIQAAALRNNAIQALSTSSMLEASRGNLATALDLVDRAVKQKFDPIREKIAAATANLDLIIKSPAYSQADKMRAQAEKDRQDEKARALRIDEENQKTIQGLALQALQNGAPSAIVDRIMNAQDIASAMSSAQGYAAKETAQSIQEYQFALRNGYQGSFSQYQNEDANRKASVARAGVASPVTTGAPTSYKEWELAGKPGTYNQWLADNNVKAPTVAQQTVATYAVRLEQAIPTIDSLTSTISKMNPITFEAQKKLPSYLQTPQYQQFDQAARNLINAVLRRESGAVISPSEFDNAYKQYLPRAGDNSDTLAEKKKNRDIVYASLKRAAGNAYQSVDELLGTSSGSGSYTSSSGKTYTLPN